MKGISSIITHLRLRLNNKTTLTEKMEWFYQKGMILEIYDNDIFFIKSDEKKPTEISKLFKFLIFRGNNIQAFCPPDLNSYTLEEAKNLCFGWNDNTVFLDLLDGKTLYMYYNIKDQKWHFTDGNIFKSPYENILLKLLYNLFAVAEPCHTYKMRFYEGGERTGVWLETIYDNTNYKQLGWKKTSSYAIRMGIKRPEIYKFEGFDKLEDGDFPKIAQDKGNNSIIITSL